MLQQLAGAMVLAIGLGLTAQQPAAAPKFDAVSVKPFEVPRTGWAWGPPKMDPEHFRIPGSPLRDIVLDAYGIDDFQLLDLPDWAAHEFFTITATTDAPAAPEQMLLMLRQVLAERFHLEMQIGSKRMPVYEMRVAPGGLKVQPLAEDGQCGPGTRRGRVPKDSISSFAGCTMSDLEHAFNRANSKLGRPVVDKTGLTGRYQLQVWQSAIRDESYTGRGFRFSFIEPFREAAEREFGIRLVEGTAAFPIYTVTRVERPK